MTWPRPSQVRTRLTLWYLFVLGASLGVFAASASFALVWQMRAQLKRHTVEDLETVEGLLYFRSDGLLQFNDEYHNHPESQFVQERYLEVLSLDGKILCRNDWLGSRTIGGLPFPGEGVVGYSERSARVSDGTPVILASHQQSLQGRTILIRVAYSEDRIWSGLKRFLGILLLSLPLTLISAAIGGYAMASRALNPITAMAQQAEQITPKRLHDRLTVGANDEVGNLSRVFNQMLSRIEQSFEQLHRFAADASHELRTPLASIRSMGEVALQKEATPDEYREIIGSILEEISRLTNLVESLLTLSRADAGQFQIKREVVSLADIVAEAASLVDVLIEEKNLKFTFETEKATAVRGDRLILRQAVVNILHNAVKFTPERGSISARIFRENSCFTLSVTDSGPGIPTEHLAKVFDRFYRIDSARTGSPKGAGLGLSIAQWAAKAHDGEIGHSPAPGGGCTFWIRIPVDSSISHA